MKKFILCIMCVLCFTSCDWEDVGKDIFISGFCSIQTDSGKVRVSQPAYIYVDYHTVRLTEYHSVITAEHNESQYTDDGVFSFLLYDTDEINISAMTEFGDTIQFFSDMFSLTADRDYKDIEIVLNHYQHVFHQKLYNITQRKEIGIHNSAGYIHPGDSLRFTINHDALSEIQLYYSEIQSGKNGVVTHIDTFATVQTPNSHSFVFVMPDYNPYLKRNEQDYYGFGIDFTTVHYGSFHGGSYNAKLSEK